MPSRRTLSNSKLIPIQVAAVNPFASFNSDSVNRLTRIVSGGKDSVVYGLDVVNGDDHSYVSAEELVPSYLNEAKFAENWTGKNYYFIEDNGVELYLPSGKTYDFSYIECKLNPEKTDYLFGSHRQFQISFELSKGTPKALVVSINDSKYTFDHPVGTTKNKYTVIIDRDLINDKKEKGLTFRIGAVLDSADPDSVTSIPEVANYHTSVRIWKMSCKLIQNSKYDKRVVAINYNGVYNSNQVHNLHTIEVTPGIAIKDDVMLQIKGNIHSGQDTAIRLDVKDNYSWIKGKAFNSMEFPPEENQQIVYQFNGKVEGRSHNASFRTTEGEEVKWGKMEVQLGSSKCNLSGDYELTTNHSGNILDQELTYQYSYDEDTDLHTFMNESKQSMGTFGGTSILFTYIDKDNKQVTFAKTVAKIDDTHTKFRIDIKTSELPLGLKEIIDAEDFGKVKCWAQIGPIKVSGDPKEYVVKNVKWAYVVLYYSYFKNPKPNIAYIGLAREEDIKDIKYGEDYLILAKVRFVDEETIDIISYEDRQFVKFPTADQIAYGPTCGNPEIWNGTLPGNVSEAITILRSLYRYSVIAKDLREPIIAELPEKFQD